MADPDDDIEHLLSELRKVRQRAVSLALELERLRFHERQLQRKIKTAQARALRITCHDDTLNGMTSNSEADRLRVLQRPPPETQDPLRLTAYKAGYTLRSLAKVLKAEGWRASYQYIRLANSGASKIRRGLAERIEELTGFRATRAHWPAGWAREPPAK